MTGHDNWLALPISISNNCNKTRIIHSQEGGGRNLIIPLATSLIQTEGVALGCHSPPPRHWQHDRSQLSGNPTLCSSHFVSLIRPKEARDFQYISISLCISLEPIRFKCGYQSHDGKKSRTEVQVVASAEPVSWP